jgi:hypothetical protein
MARMVIEYTIKEENDAGVENFKDGKMFVQFSFNDTPDDTADNLQKALIHILDKNKHYVSNISFVAKFEDKKVAEGSLYKEGEGRWINPQSETIH